MNAPARQLDRAVTNITVLAPARTRAGLDGVTNLARAIPGIVVLDVVDLGLRLHHSLDGSEWQLGVESVPVGVGIDDDGRVW